jgi:selenocysteine lyase/cysteine desulfurase
MQIDYLSADGHKWLVSPMGASVMYIRRDKLDKIRATRVGWKSVVEHTNFSTIDFRLKESSARHEEGSPNVGGILALGANLAFFRSIGVERICRRVRDVTDEAIEALELAGAEIVSPRGEEEWSGIVSFRWGTRDPVAVARDCKKRNVVIGARAGRLRISPHFYNNGEDIRRAVEVLADCVG